MASPTLAPDIDQEENLAQEEVDSYDEDPAVAHREEIKPKDIVKITEEGIKFLLNVTGITKKIVSSDFERTYKETGEVLEVKEIGDRPCAVVRFDRKTGSSSDLGLYTVPIEYLKLVDRDALSAD